MDTHCGRTGCDCTHQHPCDRGWIETTVERVRHATGRNGETILSTTVTPAVRPCPTCDPDRAETAMFAVDREDLGRRLRARSKRQRREEALNRQADGTDVL